MKARIVIGANYGDEGKGTVVANYTKLAKGKVLNVLTNGGAQRGHSILTKDGSITFQHFGSGTYHGADNYYSRYFILNPMQFVKEYETLLVKPKIYRSEWCRWTTPYDSMANLIHEQQLGRHASCCMGIWNTVRRYRELGGAGTMSLNEFLGDEAKALMHLADIKHYYEKMITVPQEWKSIWDNPNIMTHFLDDCRFMSEHTIVCDNLYQLDYDELIFENGQGLLLCDRGLDESDRTPSQTGVQYARDMSIGIIFDDITVHYVTRPYLTRHGDGNLSGESSRKFISSTVQEDRTNHYNEGQGEFRFGLLDIDALKSRVEGDAGKFKYEIELTHCDEMDRVAEFKKKFGVVNTYDTPLV